MVRAFQGMLERFGITEKILAVTTDNATANDMQMTKLGIKCQGVDQCIRIVEAQFVED